MDSLQFQKAEFEDPRPKCASCRRPMEGSYFQLAGHNICAVCGEAVHTRQARPQGAAILRGFLYGLGAAGGCAIVYSIVTLATGMSLALLSIAVGYLVRRAVRIGAGGLGGRRCQVLAVALTYFAITMSYAPIIVKEMRDSPRLKTERAKAESVRTKAGPVALAAGIAAIAAISLFAPFLALAGGASGIIGLIIVVLGLAQAWRLTARDRRVLTGPYAFAEALPVPERPAIG
jgi:hypothetical protein